MDKFNELTTGAKMVLGAAIVLLIVSFFNWFEVDGFGGESMWHGIGFLAGLLLLALIVWQALRIANINLEVGVTSSMITAALAILTLLFVFIRFIDKPGGSSPPTSSTGRSGPGSAWPSPSSWSWAPG